MDSTTKVCQLCETAKILSCFWSRPRSHDGLDTRCKSCKTEQKRLRRRAAKTVKASGISLSVDDLNPMLFEQGDYRAVGTHGVYMMTDRPMDTDAWAACGQHPICCFQQLPGFALTTLWKWLDKTPD